MPLSYAERVAADRRLVMCRLLNEAPEYRANSSILHGMLRDMGHSVGRDRVQTDIDWMAEQGVITVDDLMPGVRIVTLTQSGVDVATGASQISGIARPSPGR